MDPKNVSEYRSFLRKNLPIEQLRFGKPIQDNISYSLQYMEYITHQLNPKLHVVIDQQYQKTFIITGCSVIESILWILLKVHGIQKQTEWTQIECRETNEFRSSFSGDSHKFEVRYFAKLPNKHDLEMKFSDMCKKAEKHKVLGVKSDVYSRLKGLRELRNRVHIHAVQHDKDTDWWTIKQSDYTSMKDVLMDIFVSLNSDGANIEKLFDWLK